MVFDLPLSENFDHGGSDPTCWTIIDAGSMQNNEGTWHAMLRSGNDYYMITNSDAAGSAGNQDEELVSPILDCSFADGISLTYWHQFHQYSNSVANVDISVNHEGWLNIASYTVDSEGWFYHNISSIASGQSDVRIRFHYTANDDWWWKVDSVSIDTFTISHVENLVISIPDSNTQPHVMLNWSLIPSAEQYKIYKSTVSWQSGFILLDSTLVPQYTDSNSVENTPKSFYYIIFVKSSQELDQESNPTKTVSPIFSPKKNTRQSR